MPRYKVALSYRVKFYREGEVEVDADNERDAEAAADDLARRGWVNWRDTDENHDAIVVHPPELIANDWDECCAGMADCPCLQAASAQ